MRIRLWHRLFLALGTVSVLALGALFVLQQRDFKAGFLAYVNRLTLEQLDMAAVKLGELHAQSGGWELLKQDRRRFRQIILGEEDGAARRPPPHLEDRPDDMRPPPRGERRPPRDEMRPPHAELRRPGEEARAPPPPRRPDGANIMPRVLLIDAQGAVVVGNPDIPRDAPQLTVKANGNEVGRLLLAPIPALTRELDTGFAQTQARHTLAIALGVIGFALPLAWLLSRWLLKPVSELASGTRALAQGDYAVRLADTRNDELGDLARDFNRLASALEQHRDARRQWGADIAHELRTPLAILRGEIQALEDGVRQPTPAALASLRAECDRLNGLVDDLYQLALSDRGALEYRIRPLDLAPLIRDAADLHRLALAEAGIALEVAPLPALHMRGDAARLAQLLTNLLSNSARYTDAPGRVVIAGGKVGNRLVITVDDTAPGVPPQALPRLFDRLYRVESSRNRAAGGSGLGLSIARSIAEAHQGELAASHSALGGLRMTLTLPAEAA
ncbi:MAG: HAMP domain-containing protein [Betaproteobacteria bacterium]|nr:HAMP domain-containing protein [Betaproteobacteria bacterium]